MTATDLRRGGRTVQRVLAETRELVGPALRRAVDRLPGPLRRVAGYHFGWLDERGRTADSGAGKMIRPALALLSAHAVGGHPEDAVPPAVSVELTHNFSLVHDDVMDADRTRHHRPTVWAAFGVPTAVLAGDALWALALRVLGDTGQSVAGEATRMLTVAVQGLVAGQCADMDFAGYPDVSLAECVAMATGKTGVLLGCSCALGGLYGGGSRQQVQRLRGFGEQLGLAFQFVDDLLGIWGDPEITGKPAGSDLASRKKSLPVVAALTSGTAAGAELGGIYQLDRALTGGELAEAARLVEEAGGRAWAQSQADRHTAAALSLLRDAGLEAGPAGELAELSRSLTCRDH